ncbi:MAG: hypothetical protein ACPGVU_06285 [Limisphaerales bacterium]
MDTPPQIAGGGVSQNDAEHIRMLSVFHYVLGGLGIAVTVVTIFMIVAGAGFVSQANLPEEPPPVALAAFSLIFLGAAAYSLLLAILNLLEGQALKSGGSRTLIYVVSALNCLNVPIGTVLGVFTFIVVSRETVSGQFR